MSDSESEHKAARLPLEPEMRDMKLEEGATRGAAESVGAGVAAVGVQVKAEDADPQTPSAIPPRLKSSH